MYNFLEDTLEELHENKKTEKEVLWVGSHDGKYSITWDSFQKIAKNINYCVDSHAAFIASDLVVVGDGWWLERGELEGVKYWFFKQPPTSPTAETKSFSVLYEEYIYSDHIAELNEDTTDDQLVDAGRQKNGILWSIDELEESAND